MSINTEEARGGAGGGRGVLGKEEEKEGKRQKTGQVMTDRERVFSCHS